MRLLNFLKSILRALRELFFGKPKSDTGNKLRDFLIDLSTDENLRERFAKDPEGVMDEYGLTDEEKKWIREGDTGSINNSIGETYISSNWVHVSTK